MYEQEDLRVDSLSTGKMTTLEKYTTKTFGMMALGLLVTALTAWIFSTVKMSVGSYQGPISLMLCYKYNYLPMILLFAELGVVIAFSTRLFKSSINAVRVMYFAYAVLTGFTFSTLQFIYGSKTIYLAFAITAVYFGALCVIGFTTKMNLAKIWPLLFVGLIGIIIFNVAAMFIDLSSMDRVVCTLGLAIFTGITAFDTQKMKNLYISYQDDEMMLPRLSMYSAFELYLDFINIFLYILRILGKNRD